MTRRGQADAVQVARRGFTLVEMLVVIAIIAVLAGLGGAAYFRWIDSQRQTNTENTITTVIQALAKQMEAVRKTAETETSSAGYLYVFQNLAGSQAERARVIWVKLRLKQEFPTTFAEARQPWASAGFNLPPAYLPPKYGNLAGAVSGPGESSACLYLALKKGRKGAQAEELPSHAIADTNGDGYTEIVDGWGKPLTFVRWPTDPTGKVAWVTELNAKNPGIDVQSKRNADPIDKGGTLLDAAWYGSANRAQFESLCHQVSPPSAPGQQAYYMLPTLISAGPDGTFGTTDDVYSFRLVINASRSGP